MKCSIVCTLGPPGSPPGEMLEAMRVSHTRIEARRNVHRARQIDPPEHDARVGRGRPQRELDPLAAVHAHTPTARVIDFRVRCCSMLSL